MNQFEKQMILDLCRFQNPDKERLKKLLQKGAMTSAVLGELFWNRMAGIAYHVLEKTELLPLLHREARNALAGASEQNTQYNKSYFCCLEELLKTLEPYARHYAMLKGAYLCAKYPCGCRTSNDADLLTAPEFLTELGSRLISAGYRQGSVKNGAFVPASREEIVRSRMMRGETIPYILKTDLPYLSYFEVDVNFSLDYKNGDTEAVHEMLERGQTAVMGNRKLPTLDSADFFLHLCTHLYKEATTYPWIRMGRDMTLYKYVDLYFLLSGMDICEADAILKRARELCLGRECVFAVSDTISLLGDETGMGAHILSGFPEQEKQSLFVVISPEEKKKYRYTQTDAVKRFFCSDRASLLKEVGTWTP